MAVRQEALQSLSPERRLSPLRPKLRVIPGGEESEPRQTAVKRIDLRLYPEYNPGLNGNEAYEFQTDFGLWYVLIPPHAPIVIDRRVEPDILDRFEQYELPAQEEHTSSRIHNIVVEQWAKYWREWSREIEPQENPNGVQATAITEAVLPGDFWIGAREKVDDLCVGDRGGLYDFEVKSKRPGGKGKSGEAIHYADVIEDFTGVRPIPGTITFDFRNPEKAPVLVVSLLTGASSS